MRLHMHRRWLLAASGLVAAAAFGAGCQGTSGALSSGISVTQNASVNRGGLLYDNWTAVTTATGAATGTNPYYLTNADSGAGPGTGKKGGDSWRCKECHGWDYKGVDGKYGSGSHRTGFPGIFNAQIQDAETLFFAIRDGRGTAPGAASHGFGQWLSDDQIADLVKFIREGLIEDTLVLSDTGVVSGSATTGKTLFDSNCATCHGTDGRSINFKAGTAGSKTSVYTSEFVETVANDNPWELLHKIRVGQPGSAGSSFGAMPAASDKGYSLQDVADILAYTQTLGTADASLKLASAVRGGALYDEWWGINGKTQPTTTNPLYLEGSGTRTGSRTWRCKECHSWDYKGTSLFVGHDTSLLGRTAPVSVSDIVAALKSATGSGFSGLTSSTEGHAFGDNGQLTDDDINDLALFIVEKLQGQKPTGGTTDLLTDNGKLVDGGNGDRGLGSIAAGKAKFSICAACHGSDGLGINFHHSTAISSDGRAEYIPTIAREDPSELIHKIRYGQADSNDHDEGHMPNALDNKLTETDVSNLIAYAQTLPDSAERGGLAWDKWWKAAGIADPSGTNAFYAGESSTTSTSKLPNARTGAGTWQCKECHGWDYKGYTGQYNAPSSHATGFPGLLNTTATSGAIFAAIYDGDINNDGTGDDLGKAGASFTRYGVSKTTATDYSGKPHSFGALMEAALLAADPNQNAEEAEEGAGNIVRDLVNFILNGANAPEDHGIGGMRDFDGQLIDTDKKGDDPFTGAVDSYHGVETGKPSGTTNRTRDAIEGLGQQKYNNVCAACHGFDGLAINFKEGSGKEFVGGLARENPWEFLNKVLHGQPGSETSSFGRMPNAAGSFWNEDDLADLLLFVQRNLPDK